MAIAALTKARSRKGNEKAKPLTPPIGRALGSRRIVLCYGRLEVLGAPRTDAFLACSQRTGILAKHLVAEHSLNQRSRQRLSDALDADYAGRPEVRRSSTLPITLSSPSKGFQGQPSPPTSMARRWGSIEGAQHRRGRGLWCGLERQAQSCGSINKIESAFVGSLTSPA